MQDAKLEKFGWPGEYVNSVLFLQLFCKYKTISKFKKIRQRFEQLIGALSIQLFYSLSMLTSHWNTLFSCILKAQLIVLYCTGKIIH